MTAPARSLTAPVRTQATRTADALQPKALTSAPRGLLQRQCACGGSAGLDGSCDECREKNLQRSARGERPFQAKLAVSAPGDAYEREADRIAHQVMGGPRHAAVSGTPVRVQQLAGSPSTEAAEVPLSVERVLANPGRPLDPSLRQDMEDRFGHDFSSVRVYSGTAAENSARDLKANAYTVGHNIVLGARHCTSQPQEWQRSLVHELTHVIQQENSATKVVARELQGGEDYTPDDSTDPDRFLEYVANEVAYGQVSDDSLALEVRRYGYYLPRRFEGIDGLQFAVLLPRGAGPAIIGFRGTEPELNLEGYRDLVVTDMNPTGVGVNQVERNLHVIRRGLDYARTGMPPESRFTGTSGGETAAARPLVLTGHSLGGALAQIVGARMPTGVQRIVTFHSPGVSEADITRFEEESRRRESDDDPATRAILVTHYRIAGDIVDSAGEGMLPGQARSREGHNPMAAAYELALREGLQRHIGLPLTEAISRDADLREAVRQYLYSGAFVDTHSEHFFRSRPETERDYAVGQGAMDPEHDDRFEYYRAAAAELLQREIDYRLPDSPDEVLRRFLVRVEDEIYNLHDVPPILRPH